MREITLHWGKFMLTLYLLKQQFFIYTTEIRLEAVFSSQWHHYLVQGENFKGPFFYYFLLCCTINKNLLWLHGTAF